MPPRPWVAHYSPGVPASLDIPQKPLTWILDQATRHYGANTAIEYYGTKLSYLQLNSLVDRFAHALIHLGLQRGDRVSICLPNVPQFPIAFFGVLRAGGVAVPTNPLYTAPELAHQLQDSGAVAAITLDQFYPTFSSVRGETSLRHIILTSPADYFPPLLATLYRLRQIRELRSRPHIEAVQAGEGPELHRFVNLIGHAAGRQGFRVFPLPEQAGPNDLAVLQYTGGTTGVAKGAMLSHRNLLANALQTGAWNEQTPGSQHTTLCVAPFFHVYGLTVCMTMSLANGWSLVLLPRFTLRETISAIEKYKPDMFPGVPTLYLALAREAEKHKHDLSSIKVCISGSAPLPREVQRQFEAVSGAKVVEGYGLSEASPVTHCNPVFGDCRIGTIGLPLPDTDAGIINPQTWEFLPVGDQGEIVVRGPQVMMGYWRRPDETAQVLRDGWLRTGDIGFMDADGYFTVVDRAKDMIIAGGLKVYPRDVDEVLYENPKVLEAAAVGVPDEYRGETVRAYVVVKPGEHLTAEELIDFCKERLAPYKVPKQVEFRQELPKTLVGKVLRRTLRDEYIAEQEAARGGPRQV
ncbi:MAG: long-chain-fatty-acid--CoA ligase [Ktedonobacterales bacterium]